MNGKTPAKYKWGSPGLKDLRDKIKGLLMPGIYRLAHQIASHQGGSTTVPHEQIDGWIDECVTVYKTGGHRALVERWKQIERRVNGNAAIGNAIMRIR